MMAKTLIHMHMCNWLDEWAQTSVIKLDISLGYNINLFSMGGLSHQSETLFMYVPCSSSTYRMDGTRFVMYLMPTLAIQCVKHKVT